MKCARCPREGDEVRRHLVQVTNRSQTEKAPPWCVETVALCDQCVKVIETDVIALDD